MGKKDDAIAGLNALTEKTIENQPAVVVKYDRYAPDSYR